MRDADLEIIKYQNKKRIDYNNTIQALVFGEKKIVSNPNDIFYERKK